MNDSETKPTDLTTPHSWPIDPDSWALQPASTTVSLEHHMADKKSFTPEHIAKLKAAAKARAARDGVPKAGFKGHKHTRASKAKMAASANARWDKYWAAKQAEENAEALEVGRSARDIKSAERRIRNPDPQPRLIWSPEIRAAIKATKAEAARKAREKKAQDAAFWAQHEGTK